MLPAGAIVPLYNLWRQLRTGQVEGWHLNVGLSGIVTNNRADAEVSIRLMGPAELYEVETRIWGECGVTFDTEHVFPKMTCETPPVKLTVDWPMESQEPLWVGMTWIDTTRRRVQERAVRIDVKTNNYQRWRWLTMRNWFRGPSARPRGVWQDVKFQPERRRYFVEKGSDDTLKFHKESVPPRKIWR